MNELVNRDYVIHDNTKIHGFFGAYRFLSNFYACDVYFNGNWFPCVENAYVFAKLEYSSDVVLVEPFQTMTAAQAKKMGQIPVLEKWHTDKIDIMSALCFDKFYRNKNLREQLLMTGDKYLQESNHWNDHFWGVCNGKGQNNLGKIHMNIRNHWKTFYPELFDKKIVTQLF
jgi:ribA/ribD-fused uncharacterized protein